jgi:hypothetical protein
MLRISNDFLFYWQTAVLNKQTIGFSVWMTDIKTKFHPGYLQPGSFPPALYKATA